MTDENEELEGEARQAFQAQCFLTHNWRAFQSLIVDAPIQIL